MKAIRLFWSLMGLAVLMGIAGASFPFWVGIALLSAGRVNLKSGLKSCRKSVRKFSTSSSYIMFLLGGILVIGGFVFPDAPLKMFVSSSADARTTLVSIFIYSLAIFAAPAFMWMFADKRRTMCQQIKVMTKHSNTLSGLVELNYDFETSKHLAEAC